VSEPDAHGWMPIETARRDDDEYILVWDGLSHHVARWFYDTPDGHPKWFNGDVMVDATHWRPIPTGPTPPSLIDAAGPL